MVLMADCTSIAPEEEVARGTFRLCRVGSVARFPMHADNCAHDSDVITRVLKDVYILITFIYLFFMLVEVAVRKTILFECIQPEDLDAGVTPPFTSVTGYARSLSASPTRVGSKQALTLPFMLTSNDAHIYINTYLNPCTRRRKTSYES